MKSNINPLANTIVTPCREGLFMVPPKDEYVGKAMISYGEYNKAEADFLYELINPSSVVIEVGANIGSHTVGLARRSSHLYAFEPQPGAFCYLAANILLNDLYNKVSLYPNPVGSDEGALVDIPLLDYKNPYNFGGFGVGAPASSYKRVPILTLDSVIPESVNVSLIKIDVEGMELNVLVGATKLIKRCKPTIYLENDRREKSKYLIQYLMDTLDYDLWWHLPNLYAKDNYRGRPDVHSMGKYVSINMVGEAKSKKIDYPGLTQATNSNHHILFGPLA